MEIIILIGLGLVVILNLLIGLGVLAAGIYGVSVLTGWGLLLSAVVVIGALIVAQLLSTIMTYIVKNY